MPSSANRGTNFIHDMVWKKNKSKHDAIGNMSWLAVYLQQDLADFYNDGDRTVGSDVILFQYAKNVQC